MTGGAFAFLPWALLGLHKTIRNRSPIWLVVSGLSLTATFWRGDVHIIIGTMAIMLVWTAFLAINMRKLSPLFILVAIFALFFLGSSVKILAYFEQPNLINPQVDPHSAQITKLKLWDDIFLKTHNRDYKIPVLHGLPEHYGYFGAYMGIIPALLALAGILRRHQYRWLLLASLSLSLVIIDGSLYENFLRHFGPLSALLRMPSRLLLISTVLIALLAGFGLDWLKKILQKTTGSLPKLKPIILFIPLLVTIYVSLDLASSNYGILRQNMVDRSTTKLDAATSPVLVPHLNQSPNDKQHASVLLKHGYLLPHVCGDQNNPPKFLSQLKGPTDLSDYASSIQPNQISLFSLPANSEITVRERFVSSWHSSTGHTVPGADGSIHLLTPNSPQSITVLQYLSATIRAQQALLLMVATLVTVIIFYIIHLALIFFDFRTFYPKGSRRSIGLGPRPELAEGRGRSTERQAGLSAGDNRRRLLGKGVRKS
jgi:hypothetical protein